MSETIDHAKPHRIEANRKIAMPSIIIGLRPTRSANFPYSGTVTAWARR